MVCEEDEIEGESHGEVQIKKSSVKWKVKNREVSPVDRYNSVAKAFEKDMSEERHQRFNLTPQRAMSLQNSAKHKKERESDDSLSYDGKKPKVANKFKWAHNALIEFFLDSFIFSINILIIWISLNISHFDGISLTFLSFSSAFAFYVSSVWAEISSSI